MAQQNMITVAQRMLELVNKDAQMAELIAAGDPRTSHLDSFNRQNILRTHLVASTWRKIGRQVLAMHPAVVEEVKVASSDKIPGDILKTLPYMNPLVIYDEPPVFKSWVKPGDKHRLTPEAETSMRLLGFFTFGTSTVSVPGPSGLSRIEQRVYSTTDPDADRFGLVLMLEVLDEYGKVVDVEFNTMTLYYSDNMTLSETVQSLMDRFHFDTDKSHAIQAGQETRVKRWMREVLSTVVGTLFYLCSTTLEADQPQEVPRKTVAKKIPRRISRVPLSMYRVGWTMGAALTRYRQQRDRANPSVLGDLRHQQDPQHRRGHFKMQPYGPNKALRKLIYVSPYWTHIERLGSEGVNTARRVPSMGKNEARESVRTAIETGNVNLIETS